jgi:hypothetical protein
MFASGKKRDFYVWAVSDEREDGMRLDLSAHIQRQ